MRETHDALSVSLVGSHSGDSIAVITTARVRNITSCGKGSCSEAQAEYHEVVEVHDVRYCRRSVLKWIGARRGRAKPIYLCIFNTKCLEVPLPSFLLFSGFSVNFGKQNLRLEVSLAGPSLRLSFDTVIEAGYRNFIYSA